MTNQKSRLRRFVRIGACLATLLVAGSAVADNIVTYSAIQCVSSSFSNTGTYTSPLHYYDVPSGGGGAVLRCPLTRIASDASGDITSILVRVYENSATSSIKCKAYSCTGGGDTCDVGTEGQSGDNETGTISFNLGSVGSYTNGFAYLLCSTPSATATYRIYSYRATD
jgi:hypothetical protein